MKRDEELCGGPGSRRALASQDVSHSHGNHSIPLLPPSHSHGNCSIPPPHLYPVPTTAAASRSHGRVLGTLLGCRCHAGFSRSPLPEGQSVGAQRSLRTQRDPVLIFLGAAGTGTSEASGIRLGRGHTLPRTPETPAPRSAVPRQPLPRAWGCFCLGWPGPGEPRAGAAL